MAMMFSRIANSIKRGFTLIELLIVVAIVGLLVAISVPSYTVTRERALDKEAISALKLMRSANKQYFSKSDAYYPYSGAVVTNLGSINANLNTFISSNSWAYSIWGNGTTFRVNATRAGRSWLINDSTTIPWCTGTGCP